MATDSTSEEEDDYIADLDAQTPDVVDLDRSIHKAQRQEDWIAENDCFDDLDGRHGMHERDDVRERRLRGKSYLMDQITSFETRSVFYSSLFLFQWLVLIAFPPIFVAFTVCVGVPLCGVYMWWKTFLQKECTLSSVVHAVGRGFYDITLLMIFASYGALLFSLIIIYWFYDSGAFAHASERTIYFCFCLFIIVPFVTSEEALKTLFVRLQQKRLGIDGGPDSITRGFVIHSTCTSCGYALSQAMAWVVAAHCMLLTMEPEAYGNYADHSRRQIGLMLLVGLSMTVFGTPMHLLSGYLVGLEVTRKSFSRCFGMPLIVPTFLRTLYYVACAGWLMLVDQVVGGLALAAFSNFIVMAAMVLRVKQVEKQMPASYLRRVGYLHIAGYGILEIEDTDDIEEGDDVENSTGRKKELGNKKKVGGANPGQIGEEDDDIQRDRRHDVSDGLGNPNLFGDGLSGQENGGGRKHSSKSQAPPAATRDSVLARFAAMKNGGSHTSTDEQNKTATTEEEKTANALAKFDDIDEEII